MTIQEELLAAQAVSQDTLSHLQALQKKQSELTYEIILALSSTVEAKDRYTNGHSQRVAYYAQELARRMGFAEDRLRDVYYTGLLHDVGKIRIPDSIINKSGRLTAGEYEEMKLHTLVGYYILKGISSVSDFAIGARWHHERYDGTGFPNGLSGKNIPLISRIVGLADAYDAMTSNRSYRRILPQKRVREEIEIGLGAQFDPEIGRIFLQMIDEDTDYHMRQPDTKAEHTILAVDDDSMMLRLLEFLLKREGNYRLVTARSGTEGLDIVYTTHVDLVLLDVEMPDLNGFEVLEQIRKDSPRLPVIFMTGEKDLDMIQRAESMGVSDYLSKPLDPHILHESIQNVLLSNLYESRFAANL